MKIEIQQDINSVNEFTVFDTYNRKLIRNFNNSEITGMIRHFTEDQIYELLGAPGFNKFLSGKYEFYVTKKDIFRVTNNIDYFTMPK